MILVWIIFIPVKWIIAFRKVHATTKTTGNLVKNRTRFGETKISMELINAPFVRFAFVRVHCAAFKYLNRLTRESSYV